MSENLSKNLNLLMAEVRINAEELSRKIGLPASTIKKIRNSSDANPTISTLLPIAKFFSMSLSQLIGDEPFPKSRIKGSYKVNQENLYCIPVISWQDAILWPKFKNEQSTKITTEHRYSKNAYALLVNEDNWENLSRDTALLIEPSLKVDHRDFVIIYKRGQKTPTLKQTLFDEGQIYLKPVIKDYNIVILTPEHKILGVVVEYKKNLKKL